MIVAGLQTDVAWEDPPANFRRAEELATRAVRAGARLVVLPEMFATGFSMDAAKVAPRGPEIRDFLAGLARKLEVHVLGGYVEPGEPRPRNACSLLGPDGSERLRYHKIHPFSFAGEHLHYAAGEALPAVEVEGVRVTPVICYDLRFPELFRAAADRTDLFVVIASWPAKRAEAWRALLLARAIENLAFVLGVNRVGVGAGEPHSGDSTLLDPYGRVLASASQVETFLLAEVDPGLSRRARESTGFLNDRRPDLYRRLGL
ncbi:MAG: carbon-nitrogen family hydrolase [Planctomycetes bacterium]|jgi:predicted amidohydrolase|nr:carbon-nitrogen family hydrolase [Planctomycetota bacterium]